MTLFYRRQHGDHTAASQPSQFGLPHTPFPTRCVPVPPRPRSPSPRWCCWLATWRAAGCRTSGPWRRARASCSPWVRGGARRLGTGARAARRPPAAACPTPLRLFCLTPCSSHPCCCVEAPAHPTPSPTLPLSPNQVPGFMEAARRFVAHTLCITFARLPKAQVAAALRLEGRELDAYLQERVGPRCARGGGVLAGWRGQVLAWLLAGSAIPRQLDYDHKATVYSWPLVYRYMAVISPLSLRRLYANFPPFLNAACPPRCLATAGRSRRGTLWCCRATCTTRPPPSALQRWCLSMLSRPRSLAPPERLCLPVGPVMALPAGTVYTAVWAMTRIASSSCSMGVGNRIAGRSWECKVARQRQRQPKRRHMNRYRHVKIERSGEFEVGGRQASGKKDHSHKTGNRSHQRTYRQPPTGTPGARTSAPAPGPRGLCVGGGQRLYFLGAPTERPPTALAAVRLLNPARSEK